MSTRPEFAVIAGPNGAGKSKKRSAKHEITNHSFDWFNKFFAEAFEKLKP